MTAKMGNLLTCGAAEGADRGKRVTLPGHTRARKAVTSFAMRTRPLLLSFLLAVPALAEDEWEYVERSYTGNGISILHFASPGFGLAAGSQGYLLRTRDGGATWTELPRATGRTITAMHGPDARTVVAAGTHGALIRTADGGETWQAVRSGTASDLRALRFVDASTGFAAGKGGALIQTSDGGATWRPIAVPAASDLNALHFRDARMGFVAGAGRLLHRTDDGGASWRSIPFTDDTASNSEFVVRLIHFDDARTGTLLATQTRRFGEGKHAWYFYFPAFWTTRDGGETWKRLPTLPPELVHWKGGGAGIGFFHSGKVATTRDWGETWDSVATFRSEHWRPHFPVAIAFTEGIALAATGPGPLWNSRDGGITWKSDGAERVQPTPAAPFPIHGLHFPTRRTGFAVGGYESPNGGGRASAARTRDGGFTWADLPSPGPYRLNAVHFLDTLRGIAAGGGRDSAYRLQSSLLRTGDGGDTWQELFAGRETVLRALSFPSVRKGFAAGDKGVLLVTEDGGMTWNALPTQPVDFHSLQFLDEATGFAGGHHTGGVREGPGGNGYGIVLATTDGGRTWRAVDGSSPASPVIGLQFFSPRVGYVLEEGRGLRLTIDGGATWTLVNSGTSLTSMCFTTVDSGFIVGDSVWRTEDGGRTWTGRIPFQSVGRSAFVMPDARSAFLGGSSGTLARMLDPVYAPVSLGRGAEPRLAAAPLLELLPGRLAFSLTGSSRVTAVIVDAQGRFRARLADGTWPAGRHALSLPATLCGNSPCFLDFRADTFRKALPLGRASR